MLRRDNELMAWHNRLSKAVHDAGFNGTTLAAAMGYSGPSVNDWLKGRSQPRFEVLIQVCELVGVPIGYIFASETSEIGTPVELAAWQSFEDGMRKRGPRAILALLEGSTSVGRNLGEVELPDQPVGQHKRSNRPGSPPGSDPVGVPGPAPPGGPHQVQLDEPTAIQQDSPSRSQRKWK